MRNFRRFIDLIDRIARAVAMVCVLAVLGVMSAQVYFRYVLNSSLQWSEEFSIWAMIWTVFIGSVIVIRNWEHIYIPTAIRVLPLGLRPYFIIFSKVAALVFLCVVVFYGIDVLIHAAHAFSHNVGLSTRWAKLSIPVGAALMALMVVAQILEDVLRLLAGDRDYFAEYGKLDVE